MGVSPKPRAAKRRPAEREPDAQGEPPGLAVRRTAAAILRQVIERKTPLDVALDLEHGNPHFRALDQRDRALTRAILGQALRRRGEIEAALAAVLDKPLPPRSEALSALLHIAAAQILFLDVPDHAAVNIAVADAGSDKRTGRARGLVNGVLRRLVRERDAILARSRPVSNTPDWLYRRWRAAYGEASAAAIAEAHLATPGLDLTATADAAAWAERLGGFLLPTGTIRLAETQRVTELPGYEEGAWWVQDAAAALPARLLGDVAGKRVADLCAAPGGKTMQLAAAGAAVTAVDLSRSRLKRVAANLQRLRLDARLECADARAWRPGERFDAVLLDAPCSSTGTIRRHPDIPWLKEPGDIAKLSALQGEMLDHAATLVEPGGVLVYCTCSLEPEEGEAQVAPFLSRHPDFTPMRIVPTELAGFAVPMVPGGWLRTLPCHGFGDDPAMRGMDGFFAARFHRA